MRPNFDFMKPRSSRFVPIMLLAASAIFAEEAEANTPPNIWGSPQTAVTAGSWYDFTPTAYDPDGDRLRFSITNKPDWAWFDTQTGRFRGTPPAAGTYRNVVISVSDGPTSTSLRSFTITAQGGNNSSPNIWGAPPTSATAGSWYEFTPQANDPDGDTLTFSITNKPDWAWFDTQTGRFRGTPPGGTYRNLVISASDGHTSTSLPAFTITAQGGDNSSPNIWGAPPTEATAGSWYEFTPQANDPDGDTLTFSISNKPEWAWFDTQTGRFRGTPPGGTYRNLVISASDGHTSTSLPAFTISAEGGDNSSPNIWGAPPTSATAGSWYEFTPQANDPDGDTLRFSIANKPDWAWFDTQTGRFRGTPEAGDVATYGNIRISVSDGQDSASLSAFSISVEALGMGSATLNWTPPTENMDGTALTDLAGYRIYWGTRSGSYPNSVSINNPGITSYVIENLAPGSYTFVATSVNADGVESGYSAPAARTVQ